MENKNINEDKENGFLEEDEEILSEKEEKELKEKLKSMGYL
jgi:hypothetical protein